MNEENDNPFGIDLKSLHRVVTKSRRVRSRAHNLASDDGDMTILIALKCPFLALFEDPGPISKCFGLLGEIVENGCSDGWGTIQPGTNAIKRCRFGLIRRRLQNQR